MDVDLKQYLDGMEGRIAERVTERVDDTGLLGERMLAVEDRISALDRGRHA